MNEITPEMLELAVKYLNYTNNIPKKIKVTSEFYDYLKKTIPMPYQAEPLDGCYGMLTGIPVVIDDTIENEYYELEF